MALTEPKYRTFDELIDSVKIDLYSWDLEGLLNPQQLIKVAMRCNYDLGLRINMQKSRVIEIQKGKGRLPDDMNVLNFALVCEDKLVSEIPSYNKTYSEGVLEGVVLAQNFLEPRFVNQSTIYSDIALGINLINHNLHTLNVVVQVFNTDGTLLDFDVTVVDMDNIRLYSEAVEVIQNAKIIVMGAKISTVGTGSGSCPALLDCAGDGTPRVHYTTNGRRMESRKPVRLHMYKADSLSPEPRERYDNRMDDSYITGLSSKKGNYYDAYLKNGFLHVNFDEGTVYLNYQSVMEDDDGNLLVLDNPYTNEYYEYALKQRIFENLFMAGEQVQNHLQLMNGQLRAARNQALGFVNTPDFAEMKKLHEVNRKAQYHNYYNMFKNYL
jgi:hypothetical protein